MPFWWDFESTRFLDECLTHINEARKEKNAVARCRGLFDALNKTWDGFYAYRKRTGATVAAAKDRSDHSDLRDLLLLSVDDSCLTRFCRTSEIESLALLAPPVLNHDTLRKGDYDPCNITAKLVKDASAEHRQLLNAYGRYKASPDDAALREVLLKKTAQLIYTVRSNIAHGEKTPKGPDVKKTQRDKEVCTLVVPVIEMFFQLLFGSPDQRLALYGTLRRGEVNHALIEDLPGDWIGGQVVGIVSQLNGHPILMWDSSGDNVQVEVLVSDRLPSKFDQFDGFEGNAYERIWIPVETSSGKQICNIYSSMQG